jgi:hypothetical protein
MVSANAGGFAAPSDSIAEACLIFWNDSSTRLINFFPRLFPGAHLIGERDHLVLGSTAANTRKVELCEPRENYSKFLGITPGLF